MPGTKTVIRLDSTKMRGRSGQANVTASDTSYTPTKIEQKVVDDWWKYRKQYVPLPTIKVSQNEKLATTAPDHPDLEVATLLQMSGIAAAYPYYFLGTMKAVCDLATVKGQVSADKTNYLMGLIAGIKPRDQLESMLAVQMAAIHDATLDMAGRMKRVETLQQRDSVERSLNKLARTFAAQMEALKRYRSKGEQRVYVERVTVNEGGQAIVGPVSHGGGVDAKIDE